MLDRDLIRRIGLRVNIRMSDTQVKRFRKEVELLERELVEMERIDTSKIIEMISPHTHKINFKELREDIPTDDLMNKPDALNNSDFSNSDFFVVKGDSND